MATVKELVKQGNIAKDHWLTRAEVACENVAVDETGAVAWKGGIWEGGTWKGGTWYHGTWCRGIWERGTWHRGIWHSGTWYRGTWYRGTWEAGAFEGGTWRGGIWSGGTFIGGNEYGPRCRHFLSYNADSKTIRIGCKTKTRKEWDKWFKSKKEYETRRGTEQFQLIERSYRMVRAIAKFDEKEK